VEGPPTASQHGTGHHMVKKQECANSDPFLSSLPKPMTTDPS
jgi:hypothetical protein